MYTVQKQNGKSWTNVSEYVSKPFDTCNAFITSQAVDKPKEVYRIIKAKQAKAEKKE